MTQETKCPCCGGPMTDRLKADMDELLADADPTGVQMDAVKYKGKPFVAYLTIEEPAERPFLHGEAEDLGPDLRPVGERLA